MDSTVTPAPRVDIGALAAGFRGEVAERLATVVVRTISHLDDADTPLLETQKVELVQCALEELDSLEAHFAKELRDQLGRDGVQTWGVPNDLERLLGPE